MLIQACGASALHAACNAGEVELVRLLLASKALVHMPGANNQSPLYRASWNGHLAVVQELLDASAWPDQAAVRERARAVCDQLTHTRPWSSLYLRCSIARS